MLIRFRQGFFGELLFLSSDGAWWRRTCCMIVSPPLRPNQLGAGQDVLAELCPGECTTQGGQWGQLGKFPPFLLLPLRSLAGLCGRVSEVRQETQ